MAYSLGDSYDDDDKYIDPEAWWDPYYCCDEFFTSTAAFQCHKALFHGHRGVRAHRGGVCGAGGGGGGGGGHGGHGGRGAGDGANSVGGAARANRGGGAGRRRGPGAGAGVGASSRGLAGAARGGAPTHGVRVGGVGRVGIAGRKKGRGNAQAPQPPPQAPMTENLVAGSSLEFAEEGHSQRAQPSIPMTDSSDGNLILGSSLVGLFGEDGGGDTGGVSTGPAAPTPAPSSGAGAAGKKKKKKKGRKGLSSVPPPSPFSQLVAISQLVESLDALEMSSGCGFSDDELSEGEVLRGGYGFFDDFDDFDGYENYIDYMSDESYDDPNNVWNFTHSEDEYIEKLQDKIDLSATPSIGNDYACSKCPKSFGIKPEYLFHMAVAHKLCGACEKKSEADQEDDSGFDREEHFKSSLSCLYNFKVKRELDAVQIKELLNAQEGDRDQFICRTCGEDSGSGIALNQHFTTDHTKCRICNIQFDTQDELYNHFGNYKVRWRKYCSPCKMIFSSKNGLSTHCAESHSTGTNNQAAGGLLFTCDACTKQVAKSFPTDNELEAHLQFEHVRCFPCNREFAQKKSLYHHLTQSSEHNFCVRCDSDFTSFKVLNLHDCPGKMPRNLQKNLSVPIVPE